MLIFLRGKMRNLGAGIHQGVEESDTGHAVGHAVVQPSDQCGAIALESVNEREIPERMIAVEIQAEELSGKRF